MQKIISYFYGIVIFLAATGFLVAAFCVFKQSCSYPCIMGLL